MKLRSLMLAVLCAVAIATLFPAASAQSVTVTITQSNTPKLTGNNFYRSTDGGTTWSQIQSFATPTTSCIDASVTVGQTYTYAATALVGTAESKKSAVTPQSTVTVIPNAPSGTQAVQLP